MTWTTRLRSEFGALAAIREGRGQTVLLLHGVGLRAEAWGAQIDALAETFEVVAPDMPGHGESAPFEAPVALADYTDRVAEALAGPVFVAGHSMGAMIALDLAARYPDLVRGLGALNAIYDRSPEATAAVRARAAQLCAGERIDPTPTLMRWFGAADTRERDACARWLTEADPGGYGAAYRVFAHHDGPSADSLAALDCPALFLTGSGDPNSTPAMSCAMAELAPRGRAVVIEGAAHMAPMTHAPSVTAALVETFEEGGV